MGTANEGTPQGSGRLAAQLGAALGLEALQATGVVIPVIHESHEPGQGPVAGLLGDGPVHLLADVAVLRVALGAGAQLEHVHGLAGVELHDVADPVGQGHRVGRLGRRRSARPARRTATPSAAWAW